MCISVALWSGCALATLVGTWDELLGSQIESLGTRVQWAHHRWSWGRYRWVEGRGGAEFPHRSGCIASTEGVHDRSRVHALCGDAHMHRCTYAHAHAHMRMHLRMHACICA